MVGRRPPPAEDARRLKNSTTCSAAGYNSIELAPPLACREEPPPCSTGGTEGSNVHVDGGGGGGGGRGDEGGRGRGGHTAVTAGLVVWAAGASLVAAFLAANRGLVETAAATPTTTSKESAAATAAAFTATSTTTATSSKPSSSPDPKVDANSNSNSGKSWCLPNAAHQNFTGVVLKENEGVLPNGKWEGQHWWYHDEITSGFHMVATFAEETYGFWDLGIIGAAGNTEYVAAYKGGECLFYEEEVQPGSTPFDEDVTCRGSAWAGNVTLQKEVQVGYGTRAERWAGVIREDEETGYGGLPPGTESLIDLQRNPDNDGEVRLLYHRVVAPTDGVLRWAGGDSVAFDLVFTGLEKMTAADVLGLVKVPDICEVMAGEFHDQQARGNTGAGGVRGRTRARSRALRGEMAEAAKSLGGTSATPSSPVPGILASGERREDVRPEKRRESGAHATGVAVVAAAEVERSSSSDPIVVRTAADAGSATAAAAATSSPTGRREEGGAALQAGGRSTGAVGEGGGEKLGRLDGTGGDGGPRRLVGMASVSEDEDEEQEEGGRGKREDFGDNYKGGDGSSGAFASTRADAVDASADADPGAPAVVDVDGRGRGEAQSAGSEAAAAAAAAAAATGPGLLPIHHLMRSLGRKGYRRRG